MNKLIISAAILILITGIRAYSQDENSSESQSSSESTIQEKTNENTSQSSSSTSMEIKKTETPAQPTNKIEPVKQPQTQPLIQAPVKKPEIQPPISEENRLLAAIDANPKRGDLYNRLIIYYYNSGKHKERMKTALRAIQNIGRTVDWCMVVGDENKYMGDYQNALISYQFALMLLPTEPGIYNSIGLMLLKMSNFNQAESAFKAAIFFGVNNPAADKSIFYNNLAMAVESIHELQEAYKYYQVALKFYPSYTAAQQNAARVKNLLAATGIQVN